MGVDVGETLVESQPERRPGAGRRGAVVEHALEVGGRDLGEVERQVVQAQGPGPGRDQHARRDQKGNSGNSQRVHGSLLDQKFPRGAIHGHPTPDRGAM